MWVSLQGWRAGKKRVQGGEKQRILGAGAVSDPCQGGAWPKWRRDTEQNYGPKLGGGFFWEMRGSMDLRLAVHGMRALAAATKEEQRKSSSSRKKPGRVWLHSASSSDFGPAQWRAHRARKDPPCPCQCGRHTSATEPALQPNLPTNSLLLPLLVQASTAIQQSDASDTLLHRPHRIDSPPSIHVSSSRACPRGTRRLFSLPQPVRPANSPTESQGR